MENELIEIKKLNASDIFTKTGCLPVLQMIKDKILEFKPDMSTAKGRKEIASVAAKIAKSKVVLDDMGKDLVSDWKERAKVVDEVRRRIREELDCLKEEVRRPLTEWEQEEERKETEIKNKITFLQESLKDRHQSVKSVREKIALIDAVIVDESFGDYFTIAETSKTTALSFLNQEIVRIEKYEQEQEELRKLREQKAEMDRAERERKIADEAAAKAREEAEKKALIEKQKAESEKQEALRKQVEAEERAKRAEKEKKESEERQAWEKEQAEKKAVEQERERERLKKEKEDSEIARRKADHEHRRKINGEAKQSLIDLGFNPNQAESVVASIAMGKVRHVKISY